MSATRTYGSFGFTQCFGTTKYTLPVFHVRAISPLTVTGDEDGGVTIVLGNVLTVPAGTFAFPTSVTVTQNGLVSNIVAGPEPLYIVTLGPSSGLSGAGTAASPLIIANTGVVANTYPYPRNVVVNAKGQLTGITNGTASMTHAEAFFARVWNESTVSVPENTWTTLPIGAVHATPGRVYQNPGTIWSEPGGVFTAPLDGTYHISAHAKCFRPGGSDAGLNPTTGFLKMRLRNITTSQDYYRSIWYTSIPQVDPGTAASNEFQTYELNSHGNIYLNAGDQVDVQVFQTPNVSADLGFFDTDFTSFLVSNGELLPSA